LTGEVGQAPVERRRKVLWKVSREEKTVFVAEEYAGRLYSTLD